MTETTSPVTKNEEELVQLTKAEAQLVTTMRSIGFGEIEGLSIINHSPVSISGKIHRHITIGWACTRFIRFKRSETSQSSK